MTKKKIFIMDSVEHTHNNCVQDYYESGTVPHWFPELFRTMVCTMQTLKNKLNQMCVNTTDFKQPKQVGEVTTIYVCTNVSYL